MKTRAGPGFSGNARSDDFSDRMKQQFYYKAKHAASANENDRRYRRFAKSAQATAEPEAVATGCQESVIS